MFNLRTILLNCCSDLHLYVVGCNTGKVESAVFTFAVYDLQGGFTDSAGCLFCRVTLVFYSAGLCGSTSLLCECLQTLALFILARGILDTMPHNTPKSQGTTLLNPPVVSSAMSSSASAVVPPGPSTLSSQAKWISHPSLEFLVNVAVAVQAILVADNFRCLSPYWCFHQPWQLLHLMPLLQLL